MLFYSQIYTSEVAIIQVSRIIPGKEIRDISKTQKFRVKFNKSNFSFFFFLVRKLHKTFCSTFPLLPAIYFSHNLRYLHQSYAKHKKNIYIFLYQYEFCIRATFHFFTSPLNLSLSNISYG